MKILITQDTDWIERNPGQQHHLADRLWQKGHEIRVIDYEIQWKNKKGRGWRSRRQVFNHVWKTIPGAGVTVIRPGVLRIPPFHYISMLFSYDKEIRRQLRDFKPDVVIGHSILSNYLSMRLSKKAHIPFLFHMTDAQHTIVPNRVLSAIAKRIERMILRNANRVVVINEQLKDYAAKMGADPNRIAVVRAGIDLERYNSDISGKEIRKKLGIGDDDFVLFFMGWLYDFSGLKEVANDVLKSEKNGLKFLIVGDGDAYEDLKRISTNSDYGGAIILTGKQPFERIPKLIASADICILPAYNNDTMRDIVPIKLYEYMAMGKPVISTNLPGVRREFGEEHGVSYVEGPEEVVKRAIQMSESDAIQEEGRRARRFVEGNSWEKAANGFEKNLKEMTCRATP